MPGRKYSAGTGYRYGFNGKENDNEVKGEGNQLDYGFRIYDPRLGKFLSVDPLAKDYPWYTPYQFAGNKPIWAVDLDGGEEKIYLFRFIGDQIYKTSLTLPKAGPLGNGVAVIIIKNKQTQFMYGDKISGNVGELGDKYSASEALRNFKKKAEGYSTKVYKDNLGFPTIGIGHLLQPGEEKKYTDKTELTDQQVTDLFNADIAEREPNVTTVAQNEGLNQNEADALMDFHFNTGRAKEFSGNKSSKDGYFFLGYMKGGRGLWKRRMSEYLMFSEGLYINFDFLNSKKSKARLITSFDTAYFLDEFSKKQEEEHTKATNKTPASTTVTTEVENK